MNFKDLFLTRDVSDLVAETHSRFAVRPAVGAPPQ